VGSLGVCRALDDPFFSFFEEKKNPRFGDSLVILPLEPENVNKNYKFLNPND